MDDAEDAARLERRAKAGRFSSISEEISALEAGLISEPSTTKAVDDRVACVLRPQVPPPIGSRSTPPCARRRRSGRPTEASSAATAAASAARRAQGEVAPPGARARKILIEPRFRHFAFGTAR